MPFSIEQLTEKGFTSLPATFETFDEAYAEMRCMEREQNQRDLRIVETDTHSGRKFVHAYGITR